MLYALYQYQDLYDSKEEDMPSLIKKFLINFEYFYMTKRCYKKKEEEPFSPFTPSESQQEFKKASRKHEKTQKFYKLLPTRRHIAINKKPIQKLLNGKIKIYFQVIT